MKSQQRDPIKYVHGLLKTIVEDIETNTSLYYNSVPGFALATCGFYMAFKFLGELFCWYPEPEFWPHVPDDFSSSFGDLFDLERDCNAFD